MTNSAIYSKTSSCEDLLPMLGISFDEYQRMTDDGQFAIQQLWLSLIVWDDERMCYRWDFSIDAATMNESIEVYAAEIWDEVGNVRTV